MVVSSDLSVLPTTAEAVSALRRSALRVALIYCSHSVAEVFVLGDRG
jgi:hypothetical protein